jgi:hypothetical protein
MSLFDDCLPHHNSKDSNAMVTNNLLPAYRSLEMVLNNMFQLFFQWSHVLSNIYVGAN